ncbi:DUF3800 domain-containing protein [Clostridium perfringens]|uniref:DUF3800 domain-containing protein n=1 Tax=Clostridium perfringens TaxID=1502 RepID=UPI002FCCFFE9
MNNYYLFLDESKPNGNNINHLCLAGVIIEKNIYEKQIIPHVNTIKNSVFNTTQIVLHETEIRSAKPPYNAMRVKENRDNFWAGLNDIFSSYPITTVGASIHIDNYKNTYNNYYLNDEYFIVLQIVLESFIHFLQVNNAVGSVYIESRNPKDDTQIKNLYHKIIANGTLYFNPNAYQDKLLNINFLIKADNNIGLQLADFIPSSLNRNCNSLKQKEPSIYSLIEKNLYDGNCNMKNRFGFKVMP